MGWIRVQDLPGPKGSRRLAGVSLRESWENHIKEGKQMSTAPASVCAFPRKALWLLACIAKLVRAVRRQRVAPQGRTFEMLEPCEGKLSCTVLRGERGREAPDLPDQCNEDKTLWSLWS